MKIPIDSGDDHHGESGQGTSEPEAPARSAEAPSVLIPVPRVQEPLPAEEGWQELQAALAQKTQDYEVLHEQWLRLRAEFDNYRKRLTREFEEVRQVAAADLVIELLPGLDNLERALMAARQDSTPGGVAIAEGVEMVLRQLKGALTRSGVQELQAQGQPFDPTRHEAVAILTVPPSEDGVIVEEVQRGYVMHERILRPAKVVVGKTD